MIKLTSIQRKELEKMKDELGDIYARNEQIINKLDDIFAHSKQPVAVPQGNKCILPDRIKRISNNMTSTQPQVIATSRYSITDTATQLGVSRRTVERYIEQRKIKAQIRKVNGKRFITGSEIIRIWNQTF